MPETYEIIVKGHLDPHWSDWFEGLALTYLGEGKTLLSGSLPDQAALRGLLVKIGDLNLDLLSVRRVGLAPGEFDEDTEPEV